MLTSLKRLHRLEWRGSAPAAQLPAPAVPAAAPFERPRLEFELRTSSDHPHEGGYTTRLWDTTFAAHHYKGETLNGGAEAEILRVAATGELVGFASTISHFGSLDKRKLPDGSLIADEDNTKTRREHRMVVLPAWQGIGVGPAMSDLCGSLWAATPHEDATKSRNPCWRYMSTTAHPRFGQYRMGNPKWRDTGGTKADGSNYSHEFVGQPYSFAVGAKRLVPTSISGSSKRQRTSPGHQAQPHPAVGSGAGSSTPICID